MATLVMTYAERLAFSCAKSSKSGFLICQLFVRRYARGIKRTPVAVRTPADELQLQKSKGIPQAKDDRLNAFLPFIPGDPSRAQFVKKTQVVTPAHKAEKKSGGASKQREHGASNSKKNIVTATGVKLKESTKSGLKYEKLQDGDKRFGRMLLAAKSRKEREKSGIIFLEGRRLIMDSIYAGAQLKYLYFTDTALLSRLSANLLIDAELYKVQYHHLKMWADTQTPAGMIGVFARPAVGEVVCPQPDTLPLTLVCDNIRDPGNLGTLIRTAAAVGCQRVITTKGCVDVWDPKVLRAAMGGHFYTRLLPSLPWELIASHLPQHCYLCIADTRKGSAVEKSFDMAHPKVLELVDSADMASSTSSEETDSEESSSSSISSSEEEDTQRETPEQSWSDRKTEAFKRVPLSVVEYSDMDCTATHETVVVVGGETEGVSAQAKKLAFDRYGQYVTIPMAEAVDSLNTATAAAVVLYEARRQLTVVRQRRRSSTVPAGQQGLPATS